MPLPGELSQEVLMSASTLFVIAGAGCLALSIFALYGLAPRDGQPLSAWTRTEMRAMGSAILIMLMLAAGGVMLVKGLL
jgi:hypothetical protein